MARQRVDPIKVNLDIAVGHGERSAVQTLSEEPERGGWTRILVIGDRTVNVGHEHEVEHHTTQEEIFVLTGGIDFGDYYSVRPLAYLNHPPFWVHPAEQRFSSQQATQMLIRLRQPIDTMYEPIPEGWDGQEWFARPAYEARGKPVSRLQLDGLDYTPLTGLGIAPGQEALVLWENPAEELVTWLWRLPPGWQGTGEPRTFAGQYDELFVLEGGLSTRHGDRAVRLERGSYYCYPDELHDGGAGARSEAGLLAVRWTRRNGLGLPQVTAAAS